MAVVDTWKNKDKIQESIDIVETCKDYDPEAVERTEEENHAMMVTAKKQLARDIFLTYWKSVALGGTSVILILHGKKLMKRHIIELSTMYASLLESYRKYRQNVIDEYGAEKDQEFMYGVKTVQSVDSETGEVTEMVVSTGNACGSPYSVWFDEGTWDHDKARWKWENKLFTPRKYELEARLRMIQSECNDMLRMKGWLTLNEVYYKLGIPPTEPGRHVGWVSGGILNGEKGNDFVDFGLFPDYCKGKYQKPVNKLFLDPTNKSQKAPLLDFNVICIDAIFDDIFEYDNRSSVAYEKRNKGGIEGSRESLDRWFITNEYLGS